MSMKHTMTGNCVNSRDGWPQSGYAAKLTGSCDDTKYERTKLMFQEQGNVISLTCFMYALCYLNVSWFNAIISLTNLSQTLLE